MRWVRGRCRRCKASVAAGCCSGWGLRLSRREPFRECRTRLALTGYAVAQCISNLVHQAAQHLFGGSARVALSCELPTQSSNVGLHLQYERALQLGQLVALLRDTSQHTLRGRVQVSVGELR